MIPNITDEIVEKQKSLQAGTCLGFGLGFKIPLIVKMEMPNPSPLSSNCDVVRIWNGGSGTAQVRTPAPVVNTPTPVVNTPAPMPQAASPVIEERKPTIIEPINSPIPEEPVSIPVEETMASSEVTKKSTFIIPEEIGGEKEEIPSITEALGSLKEESTDSVPSLNLGFNSEKKPENIPNLVNVVDAPGSVPSVENNNSLPSLGGEPASAPSFVSKEAPSPTNKFVPNLDLDSLDGAGGLPEF